MGSLAKMQAIRVSPEMLTLCGRGETGDHQWPPRAVAFVFDEALNATFHDRPTQSTLSGGVTSDRIIFLVDRRACERLLSGFLTLADRKTYFLPAHLRSIALAIRDCTMLEAAAEPYRLAKSIELLCEMLRAFSEGTMLAVTASILSDADCRRIAAARQLIDDNWSEPLTLSQIARSCGLNRSKLSRGFRAIFQCSVSEALADRRLSEARRQLLSTDLPVGLIAYRSGYQNNASFSRAFSRRYGVPPSNFRIKAMAA